MTLCEGLCQTFGKEWKPWAHKKKRGPLGEHEKEYTEWIIRNLKTV